MADTAVRRRCAGLTLFVVLFRQRLRATNKRRKIWVREWLELRDRGRGVLNMLHTELRTEDPISFRNYTRIDEGMFEELLTGITHLIGKKDTVMRQAITPRQRLAATLRFLASGNSYKDLSYATRIAPNTLSVIVPETLRAIVQVFGEQSIRCPRETREWEAVEEGYHSLWQFPHCVGALDGKHINFRPLRADGSFFRNYKGRDGIILLALVDASYKFLFIDIGRNGRMNDGAVFRDSPLSAILYDESFHFPQAVPLPGSSVPVPYVIVADDAFPLKKNIMKPYPERGLTKEQRIFNSRLSRARRIVENAFGIMANRFRVLLNTIPLSVEKVELITHTCCVLHNFILKRNPQGYVPSDEDPDCDELPHLAGLSSQGGNNFTRDAKAETRLSSILMV